MISRSRLASTILPGAAALVTAVPMPSVLRILIVLICLVAAVPLAAADLFPELRAIDAIAVGGLLGLSTTVIISELTALFHVWSGLLVLALLWLTITALIYLPPSYRSRPEALRADGQRQLLIRVLWLDGRVCCRLVVDRATAAIVGFDTGLWPRIRAAPNEPVRPQGSPDSGGPWALDQLATAAITSTRGDGTRLDVACSPVAHHASGGQVLVLGPGPSGEPVRDQTVSAWIRGVVDGRAVALGVNSGGRALTVFVAHPNLAPDGSSARFALPDGLLARSTPGRQSPP